MTTQKWIAVGAGLVIVAFFLFGNIFVGLFNSQPQPTTSTTSMTSPTSNGLQMTDLKVGTGAEAHAGDIVTVEYTGTFTDGKVFDSSVGKQPFVFPLGAGQVIKGWDQGLVGMRVGGERKLVIPAELGYGSQNYGPIPANSTLIFDVKLLDVKSAR